MILSSLEGPIEFPGIPPGAKAPLQQNAFGTAEAVPLTKRIKSFAWVRFF
jgi:hypothetical protein